MRKRGKRSRKFRSLQGRRSGPPENMRTWTANGRNRVGAFVSLNEKDDILTILEADQEEFRFFFSDLSKEDQEYVQSILEK
jgi:hypothetical protein